MPDVDIHWVAVILAMVVNMVVGSYWYSKGGFGKQWSKLTGNKMEEMGSPGAGYAFTAVAAFIQAWILAHFVAYAGSTTLVKGAVTGFWLWLAFVGLTMAVNMMFDGGRKWGLLKINAGYWLVVLLINGALFGAFS